MKAMMRITMRAALLGLVLAAGQVQAAVVGTAGKDDLVIAKSGQTQAVVVVSPQAG